MDGRRVIVWTETAYKTGKCFKCGRRVKRANSIEPCRTTKLGILEKGDWDFIICPRCKGLVGKISKGFMSDEQIRRFIEEEKPKGGDYGKGDYMI